MSSKADNDAMMKAVDDGNKPTCEHLLAKDKKLKNAKNGVRIGNTRSMRSNSYPGPQKKEKGIILFGNVCGVCFVFITVVVVVRQL